MNEINFKLANRCIFSAPDCITSHRFDYYLDDKNAKIDISNAKILAFELKLYGLFVQWDEVMEFFLHYFGALSLSSD